MKITHSISEYIDKNQLRKNIHARIINGKYEYKHDGGWVSHAEYQKLYPAYEYRKFNEKGVNVDKTKIE